MNWPALRCQKPKPAERRLHRAFGLSDREAGFSLVELLVVILILGALAAIAFPAFFNQKGKASDAKAKSVAHLAQVAMETCGSDKGGYAGCDSVGALSKIESTLAGAPITFPSAATTKAYEIRVASTSAAGQYFEIDRSAEGALSHPCATPGVNGCANSGDWGDE